MMTKHEFNFSNANTTVYDLSKTLGIRPRFVNWLNITRPLLIR